MKARMLSPLERVLLLSRLAPTEDRDDIRRLATLAKERVVRDGETLLAADEPPKAVWISIDAVVQRTRNGHAFPPFTPPGPVGVIETLAGGVLGSQLTAVTGGLVLEVPARELTDMMLGSRRGLLQIFRRLGGAIVDTVGLLPHPPLQAFEPSVEGEMSLLDRLLLLTANGLLGRVALDTVAPVARLMTERRYSAGEILWTAGDVTQTGIFVADGIVRCTHPDGQTADAHPASTLGFLDHLVLDQMSLTAVATTDVVVLELPVQALVEAMETHIDLAYAVIQNMGAAVVELPILLEARVVLEAEAR